MSEPKAKNEEWLLKYLQLKYGDIAHKEEAKKWLIEFHNTKEAEESKMIPSRDTP